MFRRICNMLPTCTNMFCIPDGTAIFFSLLLFKWNNVCTTVHSRPLSRAVGGGWPPCDALLSSTGSPGLKKSLKILSFTSSPIIQPARPQSSSLSLPLSLSLSFSFSFVIRLPLPLSLSLLSSFSTLSCASHSLSSPLSLVFFFFHTLSRSLLPIGFSYSWGL